MVIVSVEHRCATMSGQPLQQGSELTKSFVYLSHAWAVIIAPVEPSVRLDIVSEVHGHVRIDEVSQEQHELCRGNVIECRNHLGLCALAWPEVFSEEVETLNSSPVQGDVWEVGCSARRDDEAEVRACGDARIREGVELDGVRRVREWVAINVGQGIY